jgi:DNA-binding response OmpR family regulator
MSEESNEPKTIVIVDDDEDLLKLFSATLKGMGYVVKTFPAGTEALNALIENKMIDSTNLLILDRMLPDMDGIEILKELQSKTAISCPVLFLSVLSSEKDVLKGLKEGAVDYITKPFSIELLMMKVKKLIK